MEKKTRLLSKKHKFFYVKKSFLEENPKGVSGFKLTETIRKKKLKKAEEFVQEILVLKDKNLSYVKEVHSGNGLFIGRGSVIFYGEEK